MPPSNSPDRAPLAAEWKALDAKIRRLLPPRYEHCYETVRPVSMGSAGLKYDAAGRVAWGEIWTSFCDLALAGGPPHRGKWLPPAVPEDVAHQPERCLEVASELARAIPLATGFASAAAGEPGWVEVPCGSIAEAIWLRAAVTAENVAARRLGERLLLPAGPDFRVEKEIKNVVVALAKTSHYWDGHLSEAQQTAFGEADFPEPATGPEAASPGCAAAAALLAATVSASGLHPGGEACPGWFGVDCGSEESAAWLLRAVVVEGVLVRREQEILFLPIVAGPAAAERAARAFAAALRVQRFQHEERPETS